jgi:hypothetical protein
MTLDPDQVEICAWCGQRRPLRKMLPLPIMLPESEESRQWHCRRELACYVRRLWKTKRISALFDDRPVV